jgi:ABC-2 type transport system ATP-binding protein
VAILQQGVLIRSGEVLSVLSREAWVELGATDTEKLGNILNGLPDLKKITRSGSHFQVFFNSSGPDAAWLNRFCFDQGIVLDYLEVKKISLESAFIELTNHASN